jgi:hypothetical protein
LGRRAVVDRISRERGNGANRSEGGGGGFVRRPFRKQRHREYFSLNAARSAVRPSKNVYPYGLQH